MKRKVNYAAIAECKRLRSSNGCMRECSFWHTHSRDGRPCFCKSAMTAERCSGTIAAKGR